MLNFIIFALVSSYSYGSSFNVSPAIKRLAEKASMTDLGQETFYRTEPEIMEKGPFTAACNKHEGSTALGCFNGRKIYIFNIPESEFEYMISTTAAHEMLHAAYERLTKEERATVDELIKQVQRQIKDEDILAKIEEYRKRDPSILPSELHSIIGTEIGDLPFSLEQHYAKYFTQRKALVRLSQKYYSDLQYRQDSLKMTDSHLDKLKAEIELQGKILRTKQGHLDVLKKQLETEPTPERVESFNKLAEQFNRELKNYEMRIADYNELAKTRNSKAKENKELYQALDSKI